MRTEIKRRANRLPPRTLALLSAVVLFAAGLLLGLTIQKTATNQRIVAVGEAAGFVSSTPVVAARGGHTFYYPWCATANRIASGNQVWFKTPQVAHANGYAPATHCPGLSSAMITGK